jgi:IclR family pca regulon transcriptional regulator
MSNPQRVINLAAEVASWPGGSDEFVEAFAKGLTVICAFADAQSPLTLADLSERTGLTRAGVRRLVLTLERLGYARAMRGGFTLTPRTLRLGYAYLSSLDLVEIAQPVIDGLARTLDETVGLSVLDGGEATFVARAEVRGLLRGGVTIGSRLPAFATSMGRVLLAGMDDASLQTALASFDKPAFTRLTITEPSRLFDEIVRIRQRGWAAVSEELELGVCGIAAPVVDVGGRTIAALNLSTNLARHGRREFVAGAREPLLEAARAISSQLAAAAPVLQGEKLRERDSKQASRRQTRTGR